MSLAEALSASFTWTGYNEQQNVIVWYPAAKLPLTFCFKWCHTTEVFPAHASAPIAGLPLFDF